MNRSVLWLVTLIQRIAGGERFEPASKSQWKTGLSIVTGFFLFCAPFALLIQRVSPQGMFVTWGSATVLFATGSFVWY